jgi:hypothetical protein
MRRERDFRPASMRSGNARVKKTTHGTIASNEREIAADPAVDRDPVAAVGVALDADRIRPVALLDIVVPHRRRLADMAVGVDDAVCQAFPSIVLLNEG